MTTDNKETTLEPPDRIWLTPRFAEAANFIGGGVYHVNLPPEEREGCIEYTRVSASTAPIVDESVAPWIDEGGHAWEVRENVTCVECPHCCFVFDAIHTSQRFEPDRWEGYDCPNCEGCPDAAASPAAPARCQCGADKDDPVHSTSTEFQESHVFAPTPSLPAREAAKEIAKQFDLVKEGGVTFGRVRIDRETETEIFERTSETAVDKIAAIISRYFPAAETVGERDAAADAYENAAVIAEHCTQDDAARDEPFRIAQTIREHARQLKGES